LLHIAGKFRSAQVPKQLDLLVVATASEAPCSLYEVPTISNTASEYIDAAALMLVMAATFSRTPPLDLKR
jgi:hypothetical protein